MLLRSLIIDDIEQARRTLADDLATYCPDVVLAGEASSVKNGIALINRLHPELVFLDIQLEDGSGFDLLEQVGRYDFKVIFTTASDMYGIKAIKFSALDYLLKPIDPDELIQAVEKAKTVFPATDIRENISIALENIRQLQHGQKRIALNTAERVHIVNVRDIIRCESQRNYTLFHLTGKRQILVTKTLKEFDDMLEDYGFFRAHHSHLINIQFLKEFVKADGGYIMMTDNSEVPVAVRKKEILLKMLGV